MIWHIFRKDFRLLWPLSLAVVLLGTLGALRVPFGGHFYESQSALQQLTAFLPYLVELGIVVVAVTVVHQDALCGSQDDWLARPLLRWHLALAKVLFVLLTVNVPLMLVDVLLQLALHFPLSVSIGVAGLRALLLVFMCSLPALMVGAVTRSLADASVFAIASAIGFVLLLIVGTSALRPSVLGFAGVTEVPWISLAAAGAVIVMSSAAVLALQYATRRTRFARSLGFAAIFAALATFVLLPATTALAVQESLWGAPASDGIRLSFDPSTQGTTRGKEPRPGVLLGNPLSAAALSANAILAASVGRQTEKVGLPLSISGLHPGDVLRADQIEVRLVSMTGRVLYTGAGVCTRVANAVDCSRNRLEVWAGSASVLYEEQLNVPIGLYQRIKDEPVRVEVSYALTRFVPQSTQMIDATGDLKTLPEMGSCATRIDNDGDEVQLGCLSDVGAPSCVRVVIEDPQTHRRNPELHQCAPRYGPYRRNLTDAIGRTQLSVPFHDLSGLAHYPVDSASIAHARIHVTIYDPVAHFRTSITVPNVRLAQWAPPDDSAAPD